MTQKLFPEADKVDITLAEEESVTVPEGEVWEVSILFSDTSSSVEIEIDNDTFLTDIQSEGVEINTEQTMHEGRTLEFTRDSGSTEVIWIGGWAFEYSE